MNDKDTIINKIIDNANINAEQIVNKASIKKADILRLARDQAKEYRNQVLPDINKYIDDLVLRGEVLSNLEAKKIILAKKKSIIDDVFKLVLNDLKIKENQSQYKRLIENMIKENAEDEDTIQFAETDSKLFDDKFLQALSKKLEINLKLSKTYGKFLGGVLISNKTCDKNLTLEIELDNIRDQIESKIATIIFGE